MAIKLKWLQGWNGSSLDYQETWGEEGTTFYFEPPLPLPPLTGTLGITADLLFGKTFYVETGIELPALTGTLGITAALSIQGPSSALNVSLPLVGTLGIGATLNITQAPVVSLAPSLAMTGTLGIGANLVISTQPVLSITPIALQGTLGVTAQLQISRHFTLQIEQPLALLGGLAVAADLSSSAGGSFARAPDGSGYTPPITTAFRPEQRAPSRPRR